MFRSSGSFLNPRTQTWYVSFFVLEVGSSRLFEPSTRLISEMAFLASSLCTSIVDDCWPCILFHLIPVRFCLALLAVDRLTTLALAFQRRRDTGSLENSGTGCRIVTF